MDVQSYPQWVYQCDTATNNFDTEHPELVYMAFSGIWPTKGRDIVVSSSIQQQQPNGTVHIKVDQFDYPSNVNDDYLRMPMLNNNWYVTPLEDGWTEIEFQTHFSAGGKVPKWVINMAVSMAPKNTLKGMRKLLAKGLYRTSSIRELPFQTEEVLALRFDKQQHTLASK